MVNESFNGVDWVVAVTMRLTFAAVMVRRRPRPGATSTNLVTVTVDAKPHTVRKGRYIVGDFKRLVGVDPSYQLDEVVNGQFVELKDTDKVSIKGKEVFVSHVRGGAAS